MRNIHEVLQSFAKPKSRLHNALRTFFTDCLQSFLTFRKRALILLAAGSLTAPIMSDAVIAAPGKPPTEHDRAVAVCDVVDAEVQDTGCRVYTGEPIPVTPGDQTLCVQYTRGPASAGPQQPVDQWHMLNPDVLPERGRPLIWSRPGDFCGEDRTYVSFHGGAFPANRLDLPEKYLNLWRGQVLTLFIMGQSPDGEHNYSASVRLRVLPGSSAASPKERPAALKNIDAVTDALRAVIPDLQYVDFQRAVASPTVTSDSPPVAISVPELTSTVAHTLFVCPALQAGGGQNNDCVEGVRWNQTDLSPVNLGEDDDPFVFDGSTPCRRNGWIYVAGSVGDRNLVRATALSMPSGMLMPNLDGGRTVPVTVQGTAGSTRHQATGLLKLRSWMPPSSPRDVAGQ
jgi:hypothetical protein